VLTLTPIAGFAVSFLIALGLTPFVCRLAIRLGAIDRRTVTKIHAKDIPRLGGLAIACGFYAPVLALALRVNAYQDMIFAQPRRIAALFGGGLCILALGVYDDLRGARAWQKLMVQIPVAMFAWWAGIRIGITEDPTGHVLVLPGAISLVATVLWIVLVVNAFNLIDGLDGLASGIALQALIATALCAWHRDNPALALFAICLSGSVGGFLVHNFHPATIFMGDSGSMLLGYVIAVSTAWSSQKAATLVGVVLPVVALALPLLDTSMAVWRRLLTGKQVLSGDLDHIHHRLLGRGWSQRRSVLTLYGVGLFFSLLSVALVYSDDPRLDWPIAAVALIAALAFARWLGYLQRRAGAPAEVAAEPKRSVSGR
jgi:UDP-GlcNAc:undecaprenyl-phosphate GlcNAc-1-phosphate transferase